MSTIKVAFLNRPRAITHGRGGDLIGADHRIAALRDLGVDAQYIEGGLDELKGFDLAHIFHIDFAFSWANFDAVFTLGLPYVLTPVFYPELFGMTPEQKIKAVNGARAILTYSNAEGREIQARFGEHISFTAIPSGTAPEFHAEPSADRVGICATDQANWKGTPFIETACKELEIPFACFRELRHSEMAAAYRQYRMWATATVSDRMSLAVGEALCSGCRCLVSTANRGNEWYPGLATIKPKAPQSEWTARIHAAYTAETWDWAPNEAARLLTWENQARGYKAAYERALEATDV